MSIYRKPDINRLRRCIESAMGCLDPLSNIPDERLAWYRLLDALDGREPRSMWNEPGISLNPTTPHAPEGSIESILRFHCKEGRVFDETNDSVVVTRGLLAKAAGEIEMLRHELNRSLRYIVDLRMPKTNKESQK